MNRKVYATPESLRSYRMMKYKSVSKSVIMEELKKFKKDEIYIDWIKECISDYFKMPVSLILKETRKREIVQARHFGMYFSKKCTKLSLAYIGAVWGEKDHATVLHACKTVENLCDTDKAYREDYVNVWKKIKN